MPYFVDSRLIVPSRAASPTLVTLVGDGDLRLRQQQPQPEENHAGPCENMPRSPSSSGLLPMPGSASSSWAACKARLATIFRNADVSVLVAFWLFGTF